MGGRNGRGMKKSGASSQAAAPILTIKGTPNISIDDINEIAAAAGLGGASVEIEFVKTLKGAKGEASMVEKFEDVGGGLMLTVTGTNGGVRVATHGRSKEEVKSTLAHELEHIRQYESGDLRYGYRISKDKNGNQIIIDEGIYWKGKLHQTKAEKQELNKRMDKTKSLSEWYGLYQKYKALPWEEAAFKAGDKYIKY